MGCFYTKMAPPSTAFSRDLSLSLKKRIPDLDDLLSSKTVRADHRQLFSLFYSIKLRSRDREYYDHDHASPDSEPDPAATPETINTWELMADLEDSDVPQEQQGNDRVSHADEGATENQPPPDLADSDAFDRTLQTQISDSPRYDLSESEQRSKDCTFPPEQPAADEQLPPPDLAESDPPDAAPLPARSSLRRKAAGMRLKLKIPSFDFHGSGELRRPGSDGGQSGGDESYETPKFGRYGRRGEAAELGDVFDPELVAEIEEAMERLTEEEEDVLRRIVEECMKEVGDQQCV